MRSEDPTPPSGTPAMPEKRAPRYGRRRGDCPHMEAHHKTHHPAPFLSWSHRADTLSHYLVVSAAISVLVLTFQVWQTLKHLDSQTGLLIPLTTQQNSLLEQIHHAVHSEGEKAREAVKDKKK